MPPDARFTVGGLIGPVIFQLRPAPAGWWLKSFVVDGVDASRTPAIVTRTIDDVEAVIATDGATLTGRVAGERVALLGATVVLFAVDPDVWFPGSQFIRRVQTPGNGRFEFGSLPPGEYFVLAVDDVPLDPARSDWQSPAALNALSTRATRVRLSPSERRTLDLAWPRPARLLSHPRPARSRQGPTALRA